MDKESGCYICSIKRKKKKYISLRHDGRNDSAHRIIWEYCNGPVPSGHVVCHKCDNPRCVNPDHLFTGTQKDNIRDATRKGRRAVGEKHPMAKLTGEQVIEIKKKLKQGMSYRKIGRLYGVTQCPIYGIAKGKIWKNVKG